MDQHNMGSGRSKDGEFNGHMRNGKRERGSEHVDAHHMGGGGGGGFPYGLNGMDPHMFRGINGIMGGQVISSVMCGLSDVWAGSRASSHVTSCPRLPCMRACCCSCQCARCRCVCVHALCRLCTECAEVCGLGAGDGSYRGCSQGFGTAWTSACRAAATHVLGQ
jgi:hypothetical protein